jgi:hypothetical protein
MNDQSKHAVRLYDVALVVLGLSVFAVIAAILVQGHLGV